MTISLLPIWIVDVGGAVIMIALSMGCVDLARRLRRRDPQNIVWAYLLWVSIAMGLFAVSRSVGHIVKQMLILYGQTAVWDTLQPFSGAINSLAFMLVGALTLFFERTWAVYQGIVKDRQALQKAHSSLMFLNQNLERLVDDRTAALTLSQARYRNIFEASKDMILTVGGDGHILDLNPAGYEMLRLGSDAGLSDYHFGDFFPNAPLWQALCADIRRQGFIPSIELDMQTTGNGRLRVMLSGSTSGDGQEPFHFVIKDIEQQYMIREQMAQADKLASIGELSAGIAHEINNPLGIILGYTQLMLRQEKNSGQRREDLKTVEKHVRNCKSIVEDLLNFARTSAPQKEMLDIHPLLDEVIDFIQQHAKINPVPIERRYDERIGLLKLDAKKIKQVLINLLMNAVYAIDGGGAITVSTVLDGKKGKALIHVRDTGSGITEDNLSRIFDPFFTTKPTGKGTGLGLSVSYGIVRTHGGDLTVDSTIGQGSTFTVTLPLPEAAKGK